MKKINLSFKKLSNKILLLLIVALLGIISFLLTILLIMFFPIILGNLYLYTICYTIILLLLTYLCSKIIVVN